MHTTSPAQAAVGSTVVLRPFGASDAAGVIAMLQTAWPTDPVNADWFISQVLLDPNFDAAGLTLAVDEHHIVGVAFGVTPKTPTPGLATEGGWIPLLVVATAYRQQGIGAALLAGSLEYLGRTGAAWAQLGGYGPAYVIPGIDPAQSPGSVEAVQRAGFDVTERPISMRRSLGDLTTPDVVIGSAARAATDGFTFRPCEPGDLPEVIEFAAREGAADWGVVLRQSAVRHRRWDRTQIARDPSGAVVGFATYASYEGDRSRFGPIAVDHRLRGRSLGAILLFRTLQSMRDEGASFAYFLWVTPGTAAERLYRSAGFTVDRQFVVLRKSLKSAVLPI